MASRMTSNDVTCELPSIVADKRVMFMPDQLRYDSLGCTGNTVIKTPRFDALAKEGTLFTSESKSDPSDEIASPRRRFARSRAAPCSLVNTCIPRRTDPLIIS